jgi:transmembrane protein 216
MINENTIVRQSHSSLPLEILIYFNWHYAVLFFVLNILLYVYKAVVYYYPSQYLGWEMTAVFMYFAIEIVRLMIGSKGNKTSDTQSVITFWVLTVPILVYHSYLLDLQTYVMRVDLVLNGIGIFFVALEFLLSIGLLLGLIQEAKRF